MQKHPVKIFGKVLKNDRVYLLGQGRENICHSVIYIIRSGVN
jgi:hypothetical protein